VLPTSLANSFGGPVRAGVLLAEISKSVTVYPLRRKFRRTSSADSPWFKRILILPVPVQHPVKLFSSTVAEITCLAYETFFKSRISVVGGRPETHQSTTSGFAWSTKLYPAVVDFPVIGSLEARNICFVAFVSLPSMWKVCGSASGSASYLGAY